MSHLRLVYDRQAKAFALRSKHDRFIAFLDHSTVDALVANGSDCAVAIELERLEQETPVEKEPTRAVSADTQSVQEWLRKNDPRQLPAKLPAHLKKPTSVSLEDLGL